MTPSTAIETALRVFTSGYAFTRSATHPYLCDSVAPTVSRLYDGPRRNGGYRREEIVAFLVEPAQVHALAAAIVQSGYAVCYLVPDGESDTKIRAEFKRLGYRLTATESLMTHDLAQIAPCAAPFPVARVETDAHAARLAKAIRRRPLQASLWKGENPPLRQYMALDGETVIGWVGSVTAHGSGWCTNMFVEPEHRRKGIATALLTRMLHDDKAAGLAANILLASHAGAKLYPTVGYRILGTLLVYTPVRGGKTIGLPAPNNG